jgi:hypothetical protein
VTVTIDEVLDVVEEILKVTEASAPSVIAVVFNPTTRQRMAVAERLLHIAVFPAFDAALPVDQNVPETALRSVFVNVKSNCTAAGVPPFDARLTVKVTFAPGAPDSPDRESVAMPAAAWCTFAAATKMKVIAFKNRRSNPGSL